MLRPVSSLGLLALASVLPGCKTIATDASSRPAPAVAAPEASPARLSPEGGAPPNASARPTEAPEAPLAWGTRPAKDGVLHPVVDGMCIHGEIWGLADGGALYSYGNGTGPWTRGYSATFARFVDAGLDTTEAGKFVTKPKKGVDYLRELDVAPTAIVGRWPEPLVLFSSDQGGSRMRDWTSVWKRTAAGWSVVADANEPGTPLYGSPTVFRGHAVFSRRAYGDSMDGPSGDLEIRSEKLTAEAPALPNLGALGGGDAWAAAIEATEDALHVLALVTVKDKAGESQSRPFLRTWQDGKVRQRPAPSGRLVTVRPVPVFLDEGKLVRLEGDKAVPVDVAKKGAKITATSAAPNGDVWALVIDEAAKSAEVVRARAGGGVDRFALPEPKVPLPKESVQHWPTSGSALAGAEVDDVWATARGGALYHFEGGEMREVTMPRPPFATSGSYRAQALVVPAKGDVYVNAGYAEKGVGWKTAERYRAVLRTKRPTEVLRCNEPPGGSTSASGGGFTSFPPIADEACTTPFVVLLRVAYGPATAKDRTWVYDRKADYPSVRDAIKATPSLAATEGATVDLVEVESGWQRYLGARVPSVAAGRELATAVAKRVQSVAEVRPEVVCATPKPERALRVEAKTGKLLAAP